MYEELKNRLLKMQDTDNFELVTYDYFLDKFHIQIYEKEDNLRIEQDKIIIETLFKLTYKEITAEDEIIKIGDDRYIINSKNDVYEISFVSMYDYILSKFKKRL